MRPFKPGAVQGRRGVVEISLPRRRNFGTWRGAANAFPGPDRRGDPRLDAVRGGQPLDPQNLERHVYTSKSLTVNRPFVHFKAFKAL